MHTSNAATTSRTPGAANAGPVPAGEWEATMPADMMATRIMRGEKEYLDPAEREIGRLIGPNLRELFVSCDAAEALRQQLEHLESRHLALHDLAGGPTGLQLLKQLAAMGNGSIRQLVIRQQGYGTTLATIRYADYTLPGTSTPVRVYSTDVETTPAAQQAIAKVMMELAQASVLILSEQVAPAPAHALRQALHAVHSARWVCPNLLVLPLGPNAVAAAASQCSQVVQRHGLLLRASPQPARGSDAWSYILGFWQKNSARGRLAPVAAPSLAPLTLDLKPAGDAITDAPAPFIPPTPRVAAPAAATAAAHSSSAARYVEQVRGLAGLLACCVFEVATGAPLAHAGHAPSALDMARQGSNLLNAQHLARMALALAEPAQELLISSERHHQVVRPVPGHPELALHALLDRSKTNQSLVRFQLRRLDGLWSR